MQINNIMSTGIFYNEAVQHACSIRLREVHNSLNKLLQWSISLYQNGNMEKDVLWMFTGIEQQMLCIRNFTYQFTIPTYICCVRRKGGKARKPTCLLLWDSQSLICVTELEIFSFLWSLMSTPDRYTASEWMAERRELRQNKSIYEKIRNIVIMAQNHIYAPLLHFYHLYRFR